MNEEIPIVDEQNEPEWQAPPPPEMIVEEKEPPQMSEMATLGNIFFEPGAVFEDLRRKPRFIIATVIICLITTAFVFTLQQKIGEERYDVYFKQLIEKNPQAATMTPEQKQGMVAVQVKSVSIVTYLLPVFILIGIALGALVYWLGTKAMGGAMSYLQAVSVWVYSSFPPTIISYIANFIVLFLKSPDDIDIATSQRGVVHANPSMFFGGAEMPVLTTLVSVFDFFLIWGLVLAAIGLHKTGKISKGAAWGIVLIVTLIGIVFRVISALFSGNPS